eukprot:3939421-Pleurochrysis_carterae.AAC.1
MLDKWHENGVEAAWGHEPSRLAQHATESDTHVHPELLRNHLPEDQEIIPSALRRQPAQHVADRRLRHVEEQRRHQ